MLREVLNFMFFGEDALASAGIALPLDTPRVLWFKLAAIISDNEGHTASYVGGVRSAARRFAAVSHPWRNHQERIGRFGKRAGRQRRFEKPFVLVG